MADKGINRATDELDAGGESTLRTQPQSKYAVDFNPPRDRLW